MVVLELKRYGDFDILQTHSIWVNTDLDTFDAKSIGCFDNDKELDSAIKALKLAGFENVKTKSITVGGNL